MIFGNSNIDYISHFLARQYNLEDVLLASLASPKQRHELDSPT